LPAKEWLLSVAPARRDEALANLAEQLQAVPLDQTDEDYMFMRTEDVRELIRLGMTVGGHTASHDNLTRCDEGELQHEIVESGRRLPRSPASRSNT